jgi:hypothetical protein
MLRLDFFTAHAPAGAALNDDAVWDAVLSLRDAIMAATEAAMNLQRSKMVSAPGTTACGQVRTWSGHGQDMVRTWSGHGQDMVRMRRSVLDQDMARTWSGHG